MEDIFPAQQNCEDYTQPVNNMLTSQYQSDQSIIVAPKFQRALTLLIEAAEYARQTTVSPWEFAVEINQFLQLGLSENDLRFLIRMYYVEHATEVTSVGSYGRQFRSSGDLYFTNRTCFVLTPIGLTFSASVVNIPLESQPAIGLGWSIRKSSGPELTPQAPNWDPDRHILSIHGHIVKQFKWAAANQETILSAFQEEGWPTRIDDPLAPAPTMDVKRRLSDTIKCLNRAHKHKLVRFRGDGRGEGVIWQAVDLLNEQAG
jgi:hypothetical protein